MKMFYNGTPIKSLNIKHFEISTNDCDMVASDLQAGKTAVAKGKKIIGTGKAFSFALYGGCNSNSFIPIPVNTINTVLITSVSFATKMTKTALELQKLDFTTPQEVAVVTIDGTDYGVTVQAANNMITLHCDKTVTLQFLFGKDEYTL